MKISKILIFDRLFDPSATLGGPSTAPRRPLGGPRRPSAAPRRPSAAPRRPSAAPPPSPSAAPTPPWGTMCHVVFAMLCVMSLQKMCSRKTGKRDMCQTYVRKMCSNITSRNLFNNYCIYTLILIYIYIYIYILAFPHIQIGYGFVEHAVKVELDDAEA